MRQRTFVTFELAGFDDSRERDGDIVVPAGRRLLSRVRTRLEAAGWPCSDVAQHSHYGWDFDVDTGRGGTTLLLQFPGRWLLFLSVDTSLSDSLWGSNAESVDAALLTALHDALVAIPDIHDLRWYYKSDYEGGSSGAGSETPF